MPSAVVPFETSIDSWTSQATLWPRRCASATDSIVRSGVFVWT